MDRNQETEIILSGLPAELRDLWQPLVTRGLHPADSIRTGSPASALTQTVPRRFVNRGADKTPADYRQGEKVGQGGMGVVYRARQLSIDREVALKFLREDQDAARETRNQFVGEATVLADLAHPSIVPFYELGVTSDGALFYSMKLISGTPWSQCLAKLLLEDNLRILSQVCDAVAFAHSRGIIHRDLKPDNIMLGEFGEVQVMDWGLAVCLRAGDKHTMLHKDNAICGTANYMAPEMARGDIRAISFASDIYLLGGILFQILTGRPPHHGDTLAACLLAAAENHIIATDIRSELMDIVRRALATKGDERQATVKAFQEEIRNFTRHQESLQLADKASVLFAEAQGSGDYDSFQRAMYTFEQALALWPDNGRALAAGPRVRREYAACALARGDLDLAGSLLLAGNPEHQELLDQLAASHQKQFTHQRRLKAFKTTALLLTISVVVILSISLALISHEKTQTERARKMAAEQRNLALESLDTLVNDVQAELQERPGLHDLQQKMLERVVNSIHKISLGADEAETLDPRLASASESIGKILFAARRTSEALPYHETAVQIYRRLLANGEPNKELNLRLAAARISQGETIADWSAGDKDKALECFQEAIMLLMPLSAEATLPDAARQLGRALEAMGDLLFDTGEMARAITCYEQLFVLRDRLYKAGMNQETIYGLYGALQRRGDIYLETGKLQAAENAYRQCLDLSQIMKRGNPKVIEERRSEELTLYRLGDLYAKEKRPEEARQSYSDAMQRLTEISTDDPTNVQLQRDRVVVLVCSAKLERQEKRWAAAMSFFDRAAEGSRNILQANAGNAESRQDLCLSLRWGGDMRVEQGFLREARQRYEMAVQAAASSGVNNSSGVSARITLVYCLEALAAVEQKLKLGISAAEHFLSAAAVLEELDREAVRQNLQPKYQKDIDSYRQAAANLK